MKNRMKKILATVGLLLLSTPALATWTYVGIGAVTGNGTNTAMTPAAPSGIAVNDIAIILTGSRGSALTLAISGWDEIATETTSRSDKAFCRKWQSGDSSPSFDWSSSNYQHAVMLAFRGTGAETCSTVLAHSGTSASSTSGMSIADATITTANTAVIVYVGKNKSATSNGLTLAPPGGFTEIAESVPSGTAASAWAAYQIQTTATSVSGLSVTQTGTTESAPRGSITLSLLEGTGGGPGSPPVGKDDITVASIGAGTWPEDFNAAVDPDIAAGDTIRIDEVTNPGGFTLTHGTNGSLSYSGDDSRQTVEYEIYDASAAGWMAGGTGLLVFNNGSPGCSGPESLVLDVSSAMTAYDLDSLCTDPENDARTYSVTAGTLPTGLSLNATTGEVTGTPTVENESGAAVTFTANDGYGATATQIVTFYPITTITVPTCTGGIDSGTCAASIEVTGFLTVGSTNYSCNAGVASGNVISQNPAASAEVEPGTSVNLVVSTGNCTNKRRPMQMAVGIR